MMAELREFGAGMGQQAGESDRDAVQSREIRRLAAQVVAAYAAGPDGAGAGAKLAEQLAALWQGHTGKRDPAPVDGAEPLTTLTAWVVGSAAERESSREAEGAQAFAAVGMTVPLLLLCGALPRWFGQPLVAPALHELGALSTVTAVLAAEAIEFVVAAMAPGGLLGGSPARQHALRISQVVAALAARPADATRPQLTLPMLQQLVRACVPCFHTDLLRLGSVEPSDQTESKSQAMYQRFRAACTLIGLGDALPPSLPAALAANAPEQLPPGSADPSTQSTDWMIQEAKEEMLRHLAYILPGTALDELPRPLTDHLLHPDRPSVALADELRRAATALWIPTQGMDDLAVIKRITRMVSSTLLIGLAGWQPTPNREPIALPTAIASAWMVPVRS